MGLRQFKQDIAEAQASEIDKISNIHRGDEGELIFTYSSDEHLSLEIRALATDVDSYPKTSEFLIFTSSDRLEKDVEQYLSQLAANTTGKGVLDIMRMVSRKLTAKLSAASTDGSTTPSPSPEVTDEEPEDSCESEFDDDYFSDSFDSMPLDIEEMSFKRSGATPPPHSSESSGRLRKDLAAAKAAGFMIGDLSHETIKTLFSLSIRVSKLGIPTEALEAWGLLPKEYIVMLVSLRMGYVTLSQFLRLPSDQTTIQFRFGKCARFKPSLASARAALGVSPEGNATTHVQGDEADTFCPLYMSNSLDALLNQEFTGLLKLRRTEGLSWDQAQTARFNLSRADHRVVYPSPQIGSAEEVEDQPLLERLPADFLKQDHALDEEETVSIPLVAMQFGIQRILRCTEYCLVCHQRVKGGFEAVKPYVCGDPLCLYQYMSLGFGQRIEQEVINSPYVVDLLVSFFHSAVSTQALREFPYGLGLKCAYMGGPSGMASAYVEAEASFLSNTIRFNYIDYPSYNTIREKDTVLIAINRSDTSTTLQAAFTGYTERHLCILDSMQGEKCRFNIVASYTTPYNVLPQPSPNRTLAASRTAAWARVIIFKCDKYIDDLEKADQTMKLTELTAAIPSVLEMRDWLLEHPGQQLSSWKKMDSSALTLLNWIVASNRSFIVQDSPVASIDDKKTEQENQVRGLDRDWMQFRFLQGSPEKEALFVKELAHLHELHGGQHPYPSLFAWHGSPLKNWHSIIRTGLDFANQAHGRSYGHGVYFSRQFEVSSGYLGHSFPCSGISWACWPNSTLHISAAVSICEIINRPNQFVSSNPHYVVQRVEWIQCRYLFVRIKPTGQALQQPWIQPCNLSSPDYLQQDPQRRIIGFSKGRDADFQIPLSAIPAQRRSGVTRLPGNAEGATDISELLHVEVPEETQDDDLDKILAGSEMVRKRRRSSDDATQQSRPSKLTSAKQSIDGSNDVVDANIAGTILDYGSLTDFTPGTLDLDTLPKLGDPTWASSSPGALKRLNREVRDLQKIQCSTDIRILGWYIDLEKLNNLFHWIVELHSFDTSLPLARDMKRLGCQSIVLELRFGASFLMTPPFVRVIRPRFLPFANGGGGHVLAGGSICTELLTNSGWSPALSLEKVFLQVRTQLTDTSPPARLTSNDMGSYGIGEAIGSYRLAVANHGWKTPENLASLESFK